MLRRLSRRIPALTSVVLLARRLARTEGRVLRVRRAPPPPTFAILPGASVVAQPVGVLDRDGALVWDAAPQLQRRPSSADLVWKPLPAARPLTGRALFAAVDGFSYYHWMTGTLPKLLLARSHGLSFDDLQHVIVNPRHKGRENFQTESLARLGLPLTKVLWIDRGLHVRADELLWVREPCTEHQTRLEPWALDLLRQNLPATGNAGPERIFVSRAHARRRRLRGEDVLSQKLAAHGFVTVTLESLPLQIQVDLFRSARVVVGLHGAGLTNVLFCAPGARVVEILPDAWPNPCFAHLAAVAGLTYDAVRATRVPGPRAAFAADADVRWEDVARALQLPT